MKAASTVVIEAHGQAAEIARAGAGVYLKLREAIVDGYFQPNERLVEADLARRFGAGRTAIRAALVRLDQEGLAERQPNRGARVRLVSDREALEIEEVRVALEQMLARHAATRITPRNVADLRAIFKEMSARVEAGDPLGYSALNARFHEMIWAIADQGVASTLVANLKSQSIRFQYRTILQPGRPDRSLREHGTIVEALASRDPDASEAAMREHLSRVVETLKQAIARHRNH
ncbi:MAG: GntR family transcriptional regulator [Candidatus Dormibacteraeota bacterium]|nr:GntR family transcriptional regulator [Candidatus Dormibacteraeota bacterium]